MKTKTLPWLNKLPEHLFISSSGGGLHDTRLPDWSAKPIRATYEYHFREIETTLQLRAILRAGPFAWPGGYPLYFITSDGAALSFETVVAEYRQVSRAINNRTNNGWRVVGCDVNYEDTELTDAHTGKPIESAYGNS